MRRCRLSSAILVIICAAIGATAQDIPCLRTKLGADPPVNLRRVTIRDGNKLPAEVKSSIARDLRAMCDCWPCAVSFELDERIRELYQWHGFYQAIANVDIINLGLYRYDIVARVQEGPQYRLADITFRNVTAFPAAELRRLFQLQAGDLFDTRKIRDGVDSMRRLYGTRGYINFSLVPETHIDSAAGTIALTIDAEEGQVFKFGPLVLAGPEPRPGFSKQLLSAWQPHIGQVYDSNFLEQFFDEVLSATPSMPPKIVLRQNSRTRVVGVRIEFQ